MIYFIAAEGTPFVKIGRTQTDINARLGNLAVGCPYPLRVLGVINDIDSTAEYRIEKKLHRHFRKYRQRGEWFKVNIEEIHGAIHAVEGGSLFFQCDYPDFVGYLGEQTARQGLIGDLARDFFAKDGTEKMPANLASYRAWHRYLESYDACPGAFEALDLAWHEYKERMTF